MANPFDQFDSAEANPFDQFDAPTEKPGMFQQFGKNVMGLGAAVGDMGVGLLKMPLAIGSSLVGKALNPDISAESHRVAGQDTVEQAFPGIGVSTGMDKNPTYQAIMKPFELMGEGINKVGDFAAETTGSNEVGGAVKLGLDIASLGVGIPGAKLAKKGFVKAAEAIDPALKNAGKKPKGADTKAAVDALEKLPPKEATTSKPADTTAMMENIGKANDADLVQRLREIDNEINIKDAGDSMRAEAAQAVIEKRQIEMELEVRKKAGLDFNAAERARQEGAPLPEPETGAMARTAEGLVDGAEGAKRGIRAEEPMVREGEGTLLTDPAGQTFKGDLNDPGAILGFERAKAITDIDNHPLVQKMGERVAKQEELLIKLGGMAEEGRATAAQVRRAEKDLANFQAAMERTKQNVRRSIDSGNRPVPFNFKKQGGAVDPSVFLEAFPFFRGTKVADRTTGVPIPLKRGVRNDYSYPERTMLGKLGNGVYLTGRDDIANMFSKTELSGGNTRQAYVNLQNPYEIHMKDGTRYDKIMNEGSSSTGRAQLDKRIKARGHDGVILYDYAGNIAEAVVFDPKNVENAFSPSKTVKSPGNKQMGGLLIDPRKEKAGGVLSNIPGIRKALGAIAPEKLTPETAVDMAKTAKDVDQNFLQKASNFFTKGGLYQALKTDNPVVRFTAEKILGADQLARADIAKYIHDPETGLGPAMRALNAREQAEVWSVMDVADKMQKELTPDFLATHGFNEKQLALVERHRQVMDYAFDQINKARNAAGLEPIDKRTAYAAMRSTGDYRSLVYKIGETGEKTVVGVIGSDWKPKHSKLKKQMEERGYEVGEMKYYGGVPRERGSAQVAFTQAIEFLAKNDPSAQKFLDVLDAISTQEAYSYLNAKTHTMEKKGIFGMEGRKSWKDAENNALEGLQAQLQYAETAMKWGHLSDAAKQVHGVINSPDVKMPMAKQWSEQYLQNAMGFNPSATGRHFEEAVANGIGKTGMGYSNVRTGMAVARKAANTILLGLNPMFWATNIVQPLASMPGMKAYLISRGLDASFDFGTGYSYLGRGGWTAMKETYGGKLSPLEQQAIKYAKDRHVYGSDLVEHSNHARKGIQHGLEQVGNIASAGIESASRRTMFFSMVHLLDENGMSTKNGLFEAAQNLTDMAMNNYSAVERPQAFNALGPIGDMAANLSSFKFNELSRTALFARQIADNKSARPLLVQLATGTAFAGITGSLAFAEADWLYKQITKAMGRPDSLTALTIRMSEDVGNKVNEWSGAKQDELGDSRHVLSHGGFSLLGMDMSKRLGLSDVAPNSLGEAVFPGGSKLAAIAGAGWEGLKNPSEMNAKRFAREAAPGALTGAMDLTWFNKKTPNGDMAVNREKLTGQVYRTDLDKYAKAVGATGIHESVEKTKLYETEAIKTAYADLRKSSLSKARDELFSTGKVSKETIQKYLKYEGDFNTISSDIQRMETEQKTPAKDLALLRATMSESVANYRHAERLMKAYQK